VWDVVSGRELARLSHRTYVRSLLFWPDGETLASASGDQTIHLWDVGSLGSSPPLAGPLGPVSRSKSEFRNRPPRPRVTELQPYATLRGHRLEVWSLALCPDNTTLVSGSKDGSVCVWDTAPSGANRPT
jgi:WD40 repeat protein